MQRHECNKYNYLCINDSLKFFKLTSKKVENKKKIKKVKPSITKCEVEEPNLIPV